MKVGISACSDGQLKEWEKQNEELETILYEQGIEATFAKHIYAKKDGYSGTDKERAEDLMLNILSFRVSRWKELL